MPYKDKLAQNTNAARWRRNNRDYVNADRRERRDNLHNNLLLLANAHCKRWGSDEEDYLLRYKPSLSYVNLALDLGRTDVAVRNKLRRMKGKLA